jgi:hypothetical protein
VRANTLHFMKPAFLRALFSSLRAATILSLVAAVGEAHSSTNPTTAGDATAGPRIRFAAPEYDFGKVIVGTVLKHDFAFTNTGDQPLIISDVQRTCGCTSAGQWTRQVQPGQSGTIPIEFHSKAFNGPTTKSVTVICNDTNQPSVLLVVKSSVWHPIEITPALASFAGDLSSASNFSKTIHLLNKEPEPLLLTALRTSRSTIAAEIQTNVPGKEYQLIVSLVPPLGTGNVFGEVTIETSLTNMPVLTVPVYALAQPAVMVMPSQITLPTGEFASPVARTISIRSNSSNPLAVSDPALTDSRLNVELTEIRKGSYFTATVTFPKGFQIPSGQRLELTLKSNHPQFPVIRVPIVQSANGS